MSAILSVDLPSSLPSRAATENRAAENAVMAEVDSQMMGIALSMARRGLGQTAPNPAVGAVVADPETGEIFARAVTAPGGRPHAEPLAIAAAGQRADRATLYVTLEPCSHQGQTAPCADAIVAAGIARVVVALEDPDPRVAGRGIERLRAAGLSVTRGVRANDAHDLTRGHIYRIAQRRPFVQLKLALGSDGTVPRGTGAAPLFVTSLEARALGHLMRAEADAIIVGAGTVRADNPELTCRLPGLQARSPLRVVLANGAIDLAGTRLAETAQQSPIIVFGGNPVAPSSADAARPHASITKQTVASVGGSLWLPAVLERLAERGITRVLVEGGPRIWRAFADAGLVDEAVMFIAGGAAMPLDDVMRTVALGVQTYLGRTNLRSTGTRAIGGDTAIWLRATPTMGWTPPTHPR